MSQLRYSCGGEQKHSSAHLPPSSSSPSSSPSPSSSGHAERGRDGRDEPRAHPPPVNGVTDLADRATTHSRDCDRAYSRLGSIGFSRVGRPALDDSAALQHRSVLRCSIGQCCAAAVMATVPNLVAELGHMLEWVNIQVGCGLDPVSCAQQQLDTLTAKVGALPTINTEEATELVSQIRAHALNEWTPGQIATLCSSVGVKCHGINTSGEKKRWQEVVAFPRFMTNKEVDSLRSGMLSKKALIQVVTNRAIRLGMHTLSEGAKGHVAAVVATAMDIELHGKRWYDLLQDVKLALGKFKAANWKHRTIWLYDNPSDLVTEPWYESAYSDGGPSDDPWEIDQVDVLRGNNKRSGKHNHDAAPCKAASVPPMAQSEFGAYSNMFGQGMASVLFNHGMAAAAAAAATVPPPATQSHWSPAQGLAPPPKAAPAPAPAPAPAQAPGASAAALQPAPEPKPAALPAAAAADAAEPDLSGEEEALRKSIAARTALRKPSAARKRPAAATDGDDDAELGADDDDGAPAAAPAASAMKAMKGTTATATHVAKKSGHVAVHKKPAKKPSKLPQPPNEGDPPLSYRAGYVGTSWSSSTYRAVVGRSDRRVRWDTGVYTRKQAFAAALEFIDERS